MIILPSSYLPSISYISQIVANKGECQIDLGEHYIKRSARNRARIMTAQGVMELTIPVKNANRPRQPMQTMQIDNSKRWQHQHWMAILSAYKSSPYFDHFAPYFEPLYRREFSLLVEFNDALLQVVFKLMRVGAESHPTASTSYITATPEDLDLRPKGALSQLQFEPVEYIQVFCDRLPFAADLSILDLLFCEGPNALDFLGASRR
ncbi:MAG: WbqC family protein [Rikenellaceae bacterium]